LAAIGGSKEIRRRALADLLGQLLGTGEVKDDIDARVRGRKVLTDGLEGIG
jgi:hypothetical protein